MWQYLRGKKQIHVSKCIILIKINKRFFYHINVFSASWLKNSDVYTIICQMYTVTSLFLLSAG
jgi:hypothetical protein